MNKINKIFEDIKNQDNRFTATPYYYVIAWTQKEFHLTGMGYDSDGFFCYDDGKFYTLQEYNAAFDEDLTQEEFEELDSVDEYFIVEKMVCGDKIFLTEKRAESYLKAKCYNYPSDAKTYVKFAGIESELNDIIEHFNQIKPNTFEELAKVLDLPLHKRGEETLIGINFEGFGLEYYKDSFTNKYTMQFRNMIVNIPFEVEPPQAYEIIKVMQSNIGG